jgi:molecular chaperone HtpG
MTEIEVGKFTLESLTTGMYSEPESCYREYIQNAVDSLDSALEQGIVKAEDFRIEIIIDADRQEVSIKDNGTGVAKAQVAKILLDIGNSQKRLSTNRGFRGIGRLGGLSYCNKLSFCTTAVGEAEKTLITFDCQKLKELLVPDKNTEYNLQRVIQEVVDIRYFPEQASAHYFIVKMEGLDEISSLLDIDSAKSYISQVAPLPYKNKFYWQSDIKEKFAAVGVDITEYPIFVGKSFESLAQIFKPYRLSFPSDKGKSSDTILGLSYFKIDYKGSLMAYGWYADTNFLGTLTDETLSGIRIRKGNIQIGDERTCAPYFKEPRFNGWTLGEVFVVSDALIPNARRDDFERNDACVTLSVGFCYANAVRLTGGTYSMLAARLFPLGFAKRITRTGNRAGSRI